MAELADRFAEIPEEVKARLVDLVQAGYAKADDNYDEGGGSNAFTYGTDVYHMTWKRLEVSPALRELEVSYRETGGRKRLLWKGLVIASHRLGSHVPSDVLEVHSSPKVSLKRRRQLGLPFPGYEEFDFDPTCNMVIGHYGNPEDGCVGIYLQVPDAAPAKKGIWAAAQQLWVPGAGALETKKPKLEDKVAAENIQPPVVRRKPKRQA